MVFAIRIIVLNLMYFKEGFYSYKHAVDVIEITLTKN
jgi:hypothetical protein